MNIIILFLLTSLLALTTASLLPSPEVEESPSPTTPCGETCTFSLCRRNVDGSLTSMSRHLLVNAAPIPVLCNDALGSITNINTGKPQILTGEGFVNLKQHLFDLGLGEASQKSFTDISLRMSIDPRFDPTFAREKGISSSFNPVQYTALNNRCIVLPVVSYSTLQFSGGLPVKGPRQRLRNTFVDCVSFTTAAPKLHFELVWTVASDDLDLEVTEPNGDTINYLTPVSSNGHLEQNNGRGGCGKFLVAGESIVFESLAEAGQYSITVKNSGRCPKTGVINRFAVYALRVFVDGQVAFRTVQRAVGVNYSRSYQFNL